MFVTLNYQSSYFKMHLQTKLHIRLHSFLTSELGQLDAPAILLPGKVPTPCPPTPPEQEAGWAANLICNKKSITELDKYVNRSIHNGYRGSFPETKRPGLETDHSRPHCTKDMNE